MPRAADGSSHPRGVVSLVSPAVQAVIDAWFSNAPNAMALFDALSTEDRAQMGTYFGNLNAQSYGAALSGLLVNAVGAGGYPVTGFGGGPLSTPNGVNDEFFGPSTRPGRPTYEIGPDNEIITNLNPYYSSYGYIAGGGRPIYLGTENGEPIWTYERPAGGGGLIGNHSPLWMWSPNYSDTPGVMGGGGGNNVGWAQSGDPYWDWLLGRAGAGGQQGGTGNSVLDSLWDILFGSGGGSGGNNGNVSPGWPGGSGGGVGGVGGGGGSGGGGGGGGSGGGGGTGGGGVPTNTGGSGSGSGNSWLSDLLPVLVAAGGQVAGAAVAGSGNSGRRSRQAYTPPITGDPLYQQLQMLSMLGLGQPIDPGMLRRSSPLNSLGSTTGLNNRQAGRLQSAMAQAQSIIASGLANGQSPDTIAQALSGIPGADLLARVASQSGYASLTDLVGAQMSFESSVPIRTALYDRTSQATELGRLNALNSIAGIQSDFVAPTASAIAAQTATVEQALRGQIARERSDSEASILEQMNSMGINPAARLGRLDEWQAQQNLEAQPNALARALQLMTGQQGLQSGALSALQGSLSNAEQTPLALLGLQSNNALGIGQLAAQQAQALAQAEASRNALYGSAISNTADIFGSYLLNRNDQNQSTNWLQQILGNSAAAPGEPTPRNTGGP